MKKGFKFYFIAWAILVVIFNVICFVIPNTETINGVVYNKFLGAFWTGYILVMLCFIGQLVCAKFAFDAKNKEKFFLNVPLLTISYSTLILSIIFGTVCMAVPNVPNWIGVVLCALILGFNAISIVKAYAAAEIVEKVEEKVKAKTQFIKLLTVDAEGLMNRAKNDEEKELTKKVYETIRYSDPMSSDELSVIEATITVAFEEFSENMDNESAEKLINLVKDRNNKCKALK